MTRVNNSIQKKYLEMNNSPNDYKLSNRLKALIVDDNKFMLQCLKYALENNGIQTVEAFDGVEALGKISNEEFDIVITDFSMPLMNGLELITEIRKSKDEYLKQVPLICLSSEESMDIVDDVMKAGANKFIRKPFVPSSLLLLIENLVAEHRSMHQFEESRIYRGSLRGVNAQ